MTGMAGCVGPILAVRLLGCTQMAPESQTVRIDRTYRTTSTDRGRGNTAGPDYRNPQKESSIQRVGPAERTPRVEVMEAVMAGVIVPLAVTLFLSGIAVSVYVIIAIAVRCEDRAYTLVSDAPDGLARISRRLNGVGRRDLDPGFLCPATELFASCCQRALCGRPGPCSTGAARAWRLAGDLTG